MFWRRNRAESAISEGAWAKFKYIVSHRAPAVPLFLFPLAYDGGGVILEEGFLGFRTGFWGILGSLLRLLRLGRFGVILGDLSRSWAAVEGHLGGSLAVLGRLGPQVGPRWAKLAAR